MTFVTTDVVTLQNINLAVKKINMNPEKRTLFMQIRVSPSEKMRILKNALDSNIPYSDYLRSVALAGYRVKHNTRISTRASLEKVYEVEPGSLRITRVEEESGRKQRKHAAG
jgi:predicted DNA binding CopG/RHH family protein